MQQLNQKTFREMIMRRFMGKGVPVSGTFELTGRCNLNCKMCYIHTKPNEYFAQREHDGAWWIALIDEACKAGMLFARLSGGECFLHPDFRQIYMHLRSKGVYVSINTNGLLLTQDMIDFLKNDPPLDVQMTLYGTDDDAYERVTGARVFHKAEQTIIRMKESGLAFHVAVTPNPYSPGETEKIIKYLQKMGVGYTVNAELFSANSDDKDTTTADNTVSLPERIQYLSALKQKEIKQVPIELLPSIGGNRTEPMIGMKCSANVSFLASWDGYVQPCTGLYQARVPLKTPSEFSKAWEKIQQSCTSCLLPVECDGCAYKKVCLPCPVLRRGKAPRGHCDPAVCETTRALVAAGVKKLDTPEQNTCE